MSTDNIAKLKLRNLQDRINSILESDMTPFDSVPEALGGLTEAIKRLSANLDRAISLNDQQSILSVSENINKKILHSLPIVGIILRSTNVRNAFELLDPLQALSEKLLGKDSKLILSSEWDYVPFAYPQTLEDFSKFTFIGLPASESSNILILPLAGHELGHSVWRHSALEGEFYNTLLLPIENEYMANINQFIKAVPEYNPGDMLSKNILEECHADTMSYALRHVEEIFCDLFGLILFGESYLRAFAYILAPSMGTRRSSDYPLNQKRAQILIHYASTRLHLHVDKSLSGLFTQKAASWSARHKFIMQITESCVDKFVDAIWAKSEEIVKVSGIERPNTMRRDFLVERFRSGMPSSRVNCLGDIVNASWVRFDEISGVNADFDIFHEEIELLNEMGLKTVEALEFRQRLERP